MSRREHRDIWFFNESPSPPCFSSTFGLRGVIYIETLYRLSNRDYIDIMFNLYVEIIERVEGNEPFEWKCYCSPRRLNFAVNICGVGNKQLSVAIEMNKMNYML